MSIINNAHPGSSIRLLCLIDRILDRRKARPIPRTELLELCRPDNLPGSKGAGERFEDNLNFWLKEGLWIEDESGILPVIFSSSKHSLPSQVLELLILRIQEKNDNDICEGNRIEPFFRTISCLLAQDKYTFYGKHQLMSGTNGNGAEAVNTWLPSEMSINVSNEASRLLEYGVFLGFLEPFENGYITDPTRAIESVLNRVFAQSKEMPIREFLQHLAKHLPMLDGGSYRQQIEPLMGEKGWEGPETHQISASLSHALCRLSNSLNIILESRSDDIGSMSLKIPGGDRSVSMVRYQREQA